MGLIVDAAAQLLTSGSAMLYHKVVINYVLGIYDNFNCEKLDLDHCIIRHCEIEVLLKLDKKKYHSHNKTKSFAAVRQAFSSRI